MEAQALKKEKTVVLIKPDGVARGLIGEIIHRFERAGLKIVALKMLWASKEKVAGHYSGSEEWLKGMGKKTQDSFAQYGLDVKKIMGTEDTLAIGKMVQNWNIDYLSSGPMAAMVLQGLHAITTVRKLVGFTIPTRAESGTIRGDFGLDSNTLANIERRAAKNLVHASGDPDEAAHEVKFWFDENEIVDYQRGDDTYIY